MKELRGIQHTYDTHPGCVILRSSNGPPFPSLAIDSAAGPDLK